MSECDNGEIAEQGPQQKSRVLCDVESERAALGSMMLVDGVVDTVRGFLKPEHFFVPGHDVLCAAIFKRRDSGESIDPRLLSYELDKSGKLNAVGGDEYLMQLMDAVPHAANVEYYARIVREFHFRRQIQLAGAEVAELPRMLHRDVPEILSEASDKLHQVLESHVAAESRDLSTILNESLERANEGKQRRGVETGFCDVDKLLCVLGEGTLNILAARPSMGKTALAGNIISHICARGGSVYFASLEQSDIEIADRLICALGDIDGREYAEAKMDDFKKGAAMDAGNRIAQWKLKIDDATPRTVGEIAAACRVHRNRFGLDLVVVDYLQLVEPDDARIPREQQVARIARRLKFMAKSLSVPVLALAQLNRAVEGRDDKRPRLADLRESGGIEADADVVMMLHRPAFYNDTLPENEAELLIKKHRGGPTGDVKLYWQPTVMRFMNATSREESTHGEFIPPPDEEHEAF